MSSTPSSYTYMRFKIFGIKNISRGGFTVFFSTFFKPLFNLPRDGLLGFKNFKSLWNGIGGQVIFIIFQLHPPSAIVSYSKTNICPKWWPCGTLFFNTHLFNNNTHGETLNIIYYMCFTIIYTLQLPFKIFEFIIILWGVKRVFLASSPGTLYLFNMRFTFWCRSGSSNVWSWGYYWSTFQRSG